jgi:hypothetical protein
MKKKMIGLLAIVVIAVVSALNVNLEKKKETLSAAALANVEALASESNPLYLWPFQGTTKDEYSESVPCTWSWEFNMGIFKWSESGSGKKIKCYNGGKENCTVRQCY